MPKKNFSTGIDNLIQSSQEIKETHKKEKTAKAKQVKATYYLDTALLDKIKAIAYYERMPIGKTISLAIEKYIKNYKKLDSAITLFNSNENE